MKYTGNKVVPKIPDWKFGRIVSAVRHRSNGYMAVSSSIGFNWELKN